MAGTRNLLISSADSAHLAELDEGAREKLKKILMEMYQEIFGFCREHNICCMLGGGSVLGAVRHQGFIPWDDDLDLNMPRKDYNRFAELFTKYKSGRYEVFVPDGKHHATNLFMKISLKGTLMEDIYTAGNRIKVGVAIDVFPIEDVPENRLALTCKGYFLDAFAYAVVSAYMFQNRSLWMRSTYCGSRKGKINYCLRCMIGFLMSFQDYQWWYCKFDRLAQSKSNSRLCTVPTGRGHFFGELRDKKIFYPPSKSSFENMEAFVPADTDSYLRQLYGDYRKMPPEHKREKHFYTRVKMDVNG